MVPIKIKENSKQAKIILEMLKTFSFVEVVPTESINLKKGSDAKKTPAPKVLQDLDLAFKQLKTANKVI